MQTRFIFSSFLERRSELRRDLGADLSCIECRRPTHHILGYEAELSASENGSLVDGEKLHRRDRASASVRADRVSDHTRRAGERWSMRKSSAIPQKVLVAQLPVIHVFLSE